MTRDWRVVIDDTGGPFTGWPSVWSDAEDRCVLHRAGFIQEFWDGPSLHEAGEIAQLVANYMNRSPIEAMREAKAEIERLRANEQAQMSGAAALLVADQNLLAEIDRLRGVIRRNCDPFSATPADAEIINEVCALEPKP